MSESVTVHQHINMEAAKTMIACSDRFTDKLSSQYKVLNNLFNHVKKHGRLEVTYTIGDNGHVVPKTKGSRKSLCIDHLWEPVKVGLLHGTQVYDYDFKNAHVNILRQIAKKNGFRTPYIDKYCAEVKYYKSLPVPGGGMPIKKIVLAWCNGGNHKIHKFEKPEDNNFFQYLKKEIDSVQDKLHKLDPFYIAELEKDPKEAAKKVKTARSAVMARPTSKALFAFHDWCTQNDITVHSMQCDGSLLGRMLSDEEVQDAVKFIEWATGFQVDIVNKPIPEFNPEDWVSSDQVGETDEECAQIFIKNHVGVDVFKSGGGFICYSKDQQKWLDDAIDYMIINDDIKMMGSDGPVPFSKNVAGMTRIQKSFMALTKFVNNTQIVKDINEATKYKIYFQDGWFDLRTGKTGRVTNARDAPFWKIDRNMPDWKNYSLDHPDVKLVREKVTNCILGDEMEPIVMGITARGAAGCIDDKLVMLFPGLRDSGKGVFCLMKKLALGTFPAGCCTEVSIPMQKDIDNGDSKSRSWFLSSNMHLARIAICNELAGKKGKKVDGNSLKSLASGGDVITARTNHKDERFEYNNSTVFFYFNPPADGNGVLPPIEPADAIEKCCILEMPYKFVSKEELELSSMFRLTDGNIKEWMQSNKDRLGNAFIWLLHYFWMPRPCNDKTYENRHGVHSLPEYMIENVQVKVEAVTSVLSKFNDAFIITDCPDDYVTAQDIREVTGLSVMKCSGWVKRNFKSKLKECGVATVTIDVYDDDTAECSGCVRGYRGIKRR